MWSIVYFSQSQRLIALLHIRGQKGKQRGMNILFILKKN